MTIPPHATQQELESILKTTTHHYLRRMVTGGVLLLPLCYLRCLLNPLWVLGLKVPGIFVTALFGCYVGWQYVNNNPAAGETALLWWALWAGIMCLLQCIGFICRVVFHFRSNRNTYQQPTATEAGLIHPQAHPIPLYKNAEGYLTAEALLQVSEQGIYALRWVVTDYDGEFDLQHTENITPATASHRSREAANTLTELYRLQPGTHRVALRLSNRDATVPPVTATLTQLNG